MTNFTASKHTHDHTHNTHIEKLSQQENYGSRVGMAIVSIRPTFSRQPSLSANRP